MKLYQNLMETASLGCNVQCRTQYPLETNPSWQLFLPSFPPQVPFNVDPAFNGENSIYLHGIHYIDSSPEFREWNADEKVCYYHDDRNLSYFSRYTQDNCLLECR